ncbi:MAG: hypothetical protein KQA33_00455 [Candidatus Aenigmarchaeota archaeon]|nr:hypothetical protein [Candidatus Aenigmarchaeota archaeon]
MRGVSAVIAVILILMITVALAATSYVWFSSVFSTVTAGGTNATTTAISGIQTAFAVEAAIYAGNSLTTVSIRNTGSVNIDKSTAAAYINEIPATITPTPSGTLAPGAVFQISVQNTSAMGNICGKPIKVSFAAGTPQVHAIGGC